MTEGMMSAYDQGWFAFWRGLTWLENPYDTDSKQWGDWDDGWVAAEFEAEDDEFDYEHDDYVYENGDMA